MLICYSLCYAAVLKILTYHAQYNAQDQEFCSTYYSYKLRTICMIESLQCDRICEKGSYTRIRFFDFK